MGSWLNSSFTLVANGNGRKVYFTSFAVIHCGRYPYNYRFFYTKIFAHEVFYSIHQVGEYIWEKNVLVWTGTQRRRKSANFINISMNRIAWNACKVHLYSQWFESKRAYYFSVNWSSKVYVVTWEHCVLVVHINRCALFSVRRRSDLSNLTSLC